MSDHAGCTSKELATRPVGSMLRTCGRHPHTANGDWVQVSRRQGTKSSAGSAGMRSAHLDPARPCLTRLSLLSSVGR